MRLHDAFLVFLRHLAHERQCAPRTIEAYQADFLQYLAWLERTIGMEKAHGTKARDVRPNDLAHFTTERVRAWQAALSLERKLGPASVRRKLNTLRSFAKFLLRTGAIGRNPMDGVTPPRARTRTRRTLGLDVLRAVLALPLSPKEATIRGVFVWAGLRLEEARLLKAGDVQLGDLAGPTLRVRGKGDKERRVPVPAPLRELLFDYQLRTGRTEPSQLLFQTDAGTPLSRDAIQHMVQRWGKAVGLHLHPHLFRHTYATGLILSGVPLEAVQQWLGHETLATTAEYFHTAQTQGALAGLSTWVQTASPMGYIDTGATPDGACGTAQESDT